MLRAHQLQVALARYVFLSWHSAAITRVVDLMLRASLDLSDEEDVDAGDQAAEALNDHNEHGDHEQCFAEDAAANESLASFDAARFAVVEGLQLLLSSMQSAVDEQVVLLRFRRCKHVLLDADA